MAPMGIAGTVVFPAYAGMIPSATHIGRPFVCVPRIRGDDPELITIMSILSMVFPAYAGMIPMCFRLMA